MPFHEVGIGSYSNRGHIYEREALFSDLGAFRDTSAVHSYFAFGEEGVQYVEANGAMNGAFTGIMYMPQLILDFDGDASSLDVTTKELRSFMRYLIKHQSIPEECLSVWFSGKKGYHIYIDGALYGFEASSSLPSAVRETVKKHYGHPMVDTMPIGKAGMIRMPFSRHPDTGMRKVPVSLQVLFSSTPETVAELMQDREVNESLRPTEGLLDTRSDVTPILRGLAEKPATFIKEGSDTGRAKHDPSRMVTCMQTLLSRGPVRGRRHQDVLRLASWLWRNGIDEDAAERVLLGWLPERELRRILKDTYEAGYSYGCHDPVMMEYCSTSCVFSKKRDYTMNVSTGESLVKDLSKHASLVRSGKGFNLPALYNENGRYRVVPGEMVVITADTGIGKSLFVQDLIRRAGGKSIYVNTECAEHLLTRRFIQNALGLTKDEVLRGLSDINKATVFAEVLDPIMMVSASPSIELIQRFATDYKPDIMVVDTTDGVMVPEAGNSDMWQMKMVVDTLRRIAQRHHVIVIAVHHINKSGARAIKGEGLEKKRQLSAEDLSGRRDIITKFDHVWALEGDRNSYSRTLRTLKQRDEPAIEIPLHFKWDTMTIGRPSPTEQGQVW